MTNGNEHDPDYAEQARRFLNQAYEELSRNDLRQASEKGWGAAAQMVKAYAAERRLDHHSHALLYGVVHELIDETADLVLFDLFGAANHLHTNFYEGRYGNAEVGRGLQQVSEFVDKVEFLLNGHPGSNGVN